MKELKKNITNIMVISLVITTLCIVGIANTARAENDGDVMYRFFNTVTGEHLYTKDNGDKETLNRWSEWKYEGCGWIAATEGKPVYRMFSPFSGEHLYTMSTEDKETLIKWGWNYEKIGWYSQEVGNKCEKPVYRLFNPNTNDAINSHHFTMIPQERDRLIKDGWNYEGIAWYSSHDIEPSLSLEATCVHEGHTEGYECKVCGRIYDTTVLPKNNNHLSVTKTPAVTEIRKHGDPFVNRSWTYYCDICKEAICDDSEPNAGDIEVEHFNKKHGFNYHLVEYFNNLEEQAKTDEELEAVWKKASDECQDMDKYIKVKETGTYWEEEVVVVPERYHCDDCGKVSLDGGKTWV